MALGDERACERFLEKTVHVNPEGGRALCVCSTKRKTKKPPQYRVLLHNDNFNKREYVVQVLLKVSPSVFFACVFRSLRNFRKGPVRCLWIRISHTPDKQGRILTACHDGFTIHTSAGALMCRRRNIGLYVGKQTRLHSNDVRASLLVVV
eukprot:6357198-Pyramimonas_sp.AAC.1